MIDPQTLTPADVGRSVTYHGEYGPPEHGKLSSWNQRFIFVKFKGPDGEPCRPKDVSFDFEGRE